MDRLDTNAALVTLFKEVFEGIPKGADGTWFVQGNEGIFDVFESVDATKASQRPTEQSSSIGAHVRHLCYYLSFLNVSARGEKAEADWAGSWSKQEFTSSEWSDLQTELRQEYDSALTYLESKPDFKHQDNLTYAFAQVAHASYHLGAVRALMKI